MEHTTILRRSAIAIAAHFDKLAFPLKCSLDELRGLYDVDTDGGMPAGGSGDLLAVADAAGVTRKAVAP